MKARQVALVTGGSKRIGAVIVRQLAEAGYAVVIHYHHGREAAEALAAELAGRGFRAATTGGDLAALETLPALMAEAARPFGPPDLLVNNASTFLDDRIGTLEPARFATNL
ncbi:MAG: SDR family NAD(P)-dependent oxidoreductase, partial [Rhabdaerophilum sp.]